jgi:DNA-binding transcriptional MerR regulator
MFRIGEFARLTRVSMVTLRHYDDIGLFKPAYIDSLTDYRYYTFDQVPRLNRILALKGLGFKLEQVRQILDGGLTADELRGMLLLRQSQIEHEIDTARDMLAQVAQRLQQIEQEGKMPDIEVLTKQVAPISIVAAREVVATPAQMRERCIALDKEVWALIHAHGLKTDGVSFALYHPEQADGIDVEMAYAIDAANANDQLHGAAAVRTLPGAMVAYAVYNGSYDDFGAVGQFHGAIHSWIEANGWHISGAVREFYLQPPAGGFANTGVMEIQYPVERA